MESEFQRQKKEFEQKFRNMYLKNPLHVLKEGKLPDASKSIV